MKYSLFFLFFLLSLNLFSQKDSTESDLKIGLVLSGGGAKGLAHIGALKEIDDAGIRIDYIGGTSMGAIIGSLYASGYSANQLDSIFRKTNFKTLIQDDLPRRVKTYYEKEGAQRYIVNLPFNNFKLSMPTGLSKGQNVYNLLSQLMYPVREIEDFSKLPIPFFSMGTDIETGKRIVLEKGYLPKTVLASSAIPSLFKPVLIGDKLVSDGGITDNYPIEELMKHDVDYIIGVDVQDSLESRKNLKSVIDILTQVNNFGRIKVMRNKSKKTDLYIKPDIRDFTILDFDKGDKIIKSGETAASKMSATLDSLARQQKGPKKKYFTKIRDSISIGEIKIYGNKINKRNYIRGKLRVPTHKTTSYKHLNEGLQNLVASGDFEKIAYKLIPQESGNDNLNLYLDENKNKTILKLSLHYDQLYKSSALINLTHKNLFFRNDIISFDFIPGENIRYKFNYFIDKGYYWSLGLRSELNKFDKNVDLGFIADQLPVDISNINKAQLDYSDLTNQVYVETFLLRSLRLGLGLEHKYTKLKTETIQLKSQLNESVLEKSHSFGPYGYLEYDSYNKTYFPSKGFYFRGDFHSYLFGASTSFDFKRFSTVKGKLGFAINPLSKFSVRAQATTGFHINHTKMTALNYFLGGYGNDYVNNIEPFFGYDFIEKSGNSFIKASLKLDYELFSKNHVMLGFNVANIGHNLYDHGKIFEWPDYSGVFVGYGLETFFGPLQAYYSISPERGTSEVFVSLGFWF